MTEGEIREFIAAHSWREAKSAKDTHPHSYLVRDCARSDSEFVRFVEFIRSNGYDVKWWRRDYRYLDFEGHHYWTMGNDISITVILNRATYPEGHDAVPFFLRNPFIFEVAPWEGDWDRYMDIRGVGP